MRRAENRILDHPTKFELRLPEAGNPDIPSYPPNTPSTSITETHTHLQEQKQKSMRKNLCEMFSTVTKRTINERLQSMNSDQMKVPKTNEIIANKKPVQSSKKLKKKCNIKLIHSTRKMEDPQDAQNAHLIFGKSFQKKAAACHASDLCLCRF